MGVGATRSTPLYFYKWCSCLDWDSGLIHECVPNYIMSANSKAWGTSLIKPGQARCRQDGNNVSVCSFSADLYGPEKQSIETPTAYLSWTVYYRALDNPYGKELMKSLMTLPPLMNSEVATINLQWLYKRRGYSLSAFKYFVEQPSPRWISLWSADCSTWLYCLQSKTY